MTKTTTCLLSILVLNMTLVKAGHNERSAAPTPDTLAVTPIDHDFNTTPMGTPVLEHAPVYPVTTSDYSTDTSLNAVNQTTETIFLQFRCTYPNRTTFLSCLSSDKRTIAQFFNDHKRTLAEADVIDYGNIDANYEFELVSCNDIFTSAYIPNDTLITDIRGCIEPKIIRPIESTLETDTSIASTIGADGNHWFE